MKKYGITYYEITNPTSSNNIAAGYSLGQKWFNSNTGVEFIHISDLVWIESIIDTDNLIQKAISVTYSELVNLKASSSLVSLQTYLINDYRTIYTQPISNVLMGGKNITINNPGTGYSATNYSLIGGNNDATVDVLVNGNGSITQVTLVNGGTGYVDGTYTINNSGTNNATINVMVNIDGIISSFKNENQIEPLLITAVSSTKLSVKGRSTVYGNDEIYYDIVSNQEMVPGCTKGYIYRRVDTLKNNDIGFDYRNVKFRRWQIDVTNIWDNVSTYIKGDVVLKNETSEIYISLVDDNLNNDLSIINKWELFEWDNLSYTSPIETNWEVNNLLIRCSSLFTDYYMFSIEYYSGEGIQSDYNGIHNNIFKGNNTSILFNSNSVLFGYDFFNNTVGKYFYINTIGNGLSFNIIGEYFSTNTVGINFSYNTLGNNITNNKIGYNFSYNMVGDGFTYNTIGNSSASNIIIDNFTNNIIGIDFSYNTIGNECTGNNIGDEFKNNIIRDYFKNNRIGNIDNNNNIEYDFSNNQIYGNFSNNKIGTGFRNNIITDQCYNNIIGNEFTTNNIGIYFFNNIIGSYFESCVIGNEFSSNIVNNTFYNIRIGNFFKKNIILPEIISKDFQGYSSYVLSPVTDSTILPLVDTTNFDLSGTFIYNGSAYTYTDISVNVLTGVSPNITAVPLFGYVQFINELSELYNKEYGHQITQTQNKVNIQWIDIYGSTNIIEI